MFVFLSNAQQDSIGWVIPQRLTIWGIDTFIQIQLPSVKLANKTTESKINRQLSVDTLIGQPLAELQEVGDISGLPTGWNGMFYEITGHKGGLFSITIYKEWLGIHYYVSTEYMVFDTTDGSRINSSDLFDSLKINTLVKICNDSSQAILQRYYKHWDEASPEEKENYRERYGDWYFTIDNLDDFAITKQGVIIYPDFYVGPGSVAEEPTEHIFISHQQMSQFYTQAFRRLLAP